ncbi:hypothetical protein [Dyella japonica]|uniref:Uncharacterized protein n=1 Tax=Dyella japonica A8 TaxID=1217721 RepID=A0A075JVJ7_9GAMM|nr:hypothetical protein [Dyella japonica]AIF45954.1 hypothetical protein HY57_01070 [Dyella japonica A8]
MDIRVIPRIGWLLALLCLGLFPTQGHAEAPVQVSVCQLLEDPGRYNHALVEVTGRAGHGFEDFSLTAGHCADSVHVSGIWLEYGGTHASGTMYCCGVTRIRTRPEALVVEGVTTRLRDDKVFQDFDQIIQKEPYARAQVTVVGRFFSGEPRQFPRGTVWAGYGHMGLFSLLVIEQVLAVSALPDQD